MKKRWLAAALCAVMLMTLFACAPAPGEPRLVSVYPVSDTKLKITFSCPVDFDFSVSTRFALRVLDEQDNMVSGTTDAYNTMTAEKFEWADGMHTSVYWTVPSGVNHTPSAAHWLTIAESLPAGQHVGFCIIDISETQDDERIDSVMNAQDHTLILKRTNTGSGAGTAAVRLTDTDPEAADLKALGRARAWVADRVEKNDLFTFGYNGKTMAQHIGSWSKSVEWADANTMTLTYRSGEGVKAVATLTVDPEYAAVDWVVNFTNEGASDAPAIRDIHILDASLPLKNARLTSTVGSDGKETDFTPFTVDLSQRDYSLGSTTGRSSSLAWPYFDLCADGVGVMGALGWTGNWAMNFADVTDGTHITAGMRATDIALHTGESMRTPSMVLVFFDGDQDAGHNALRSLILKSYTPSRKGKTLSVLPTFVNSWGGAGLESHLNCARYMAENTVPYDGMWIDAGWYTSAPTADSHSMEWFNESGTWEFSTHAQMYPNGIKPLADEMAADGRDLMVWFEPERAMPETKMITEHPEYFLPKTTGDAFYLYDLGNSEAVEFLVSYITGLMKANGITCYRQDFNINPTETWRNADQKEGSHRTGISEIKYISGLYDYFDGLREAMPGLMIDNCSGGGRRLDIEMLRRSVAYWTTDYLSLAENTVDNARNINFNLRWWLPVFAYSASKEGRTNDYRMRSMYANGVSVGVSVSNREWYLQALEELHAFRPFASADYYILASADGEELTKRNAAYEFYLPDMGEGRLLVFRPAESTAGTQVCRLKGLMDDATYQITITDTGTEFTKTGEELMTEGLSVSLDAGTSRLINIVEEREPGVLLFTLFKGEGAPIGS